MRLPQSNYPSTCKALERHLGSPIPTYDEEPDAYGAWYTKRWSLDKMRTRLALFAIGAYGVGMFALIPQSTQKVV